MDGRYKRMGWGEFGWNFKGPRHPCTCGMNLHLYVIIFYCFFFYPDSDIYLGGLDPKTFRKLHLRLHDNYKTCLCCDYLIHQYPEIEF